MFEHIIKSIEKYDSIVIFGHAHPDGDCYGSQIGLRDSLRLAYPNKNIYAIGDGLPQFFSLIGKMDEVDDEIVSNSLAVILDGNDLNRMSDKRIHNCLAFCKIDHHVDTGSFIEGPQVVDVNANSTCDMITAMIIEQHLPINKNIANALYLGIITDSGRFQYVSNYISTYERVAFLCKSGATPKPINDILNVTSEKIINLKKFVYNNYKKTNNVLYVVFKKDELQSLGVDANKASSVVNLLANVEGYPVWASFAEYDDGSVRIEFRSNGPAVQPLALSLGGGGHMYAAGLSLPKLDPERINDIVNLLDEVATKWKEK